MSNYVCGFAFEKTTYQLLLVKKQKPEWQAGMLNGIGGKIEPGEDAISAMTREFLEECGIETNPVDWQLLCVLYTNGVKIHFFRTDLSSDKFRSFRTCESEEIYSIHYQDVQHMNVVPNLRWLVPFAYYNNKEYSSFNLNCVDPASVMG